MANDPTGTGSGSGNGRGRSDADDFAEPEEPTGVISSERFVLDIIGRLAGGLRRAADRCDEFGSLVEEVGPEVALADLFEEMTDLEIIVSGSRRGVRRLMTGAQKKDEGTT